MVRRRHYQNPTLSITYVCEFLYTQYFWFLCSTNCYTSHLKPQFYFTNSDTFLLTSLFLTDFNNPYLKSILQYTNVNTSLIKSMSPSHQTSLPHITHFNTSLLNSMFSVPSSSLSPTKSLHYTNLARANGHWPSTQPGSGWCWFGVALELCATMGSLCCYLGINLRSSGSIWYYFPIMFFCNR